MIECLAGTAPTAVRANRERGVWFITGATPAGEVRVAIRPEDAGLLALARGGEDVRALAFAAASAKGYDVPQGLAGTVLAPDERRARIPGTALLAAYWNVRTMGDVDVAAREEEGVWFVVASMREEAVPDGTTSVAFRAADAKLYTVVPRGHIGDAIRGMVLRSHRGRKG